jgi:hypothetical protein
MMTHQLQSPQLDNDSLRMSQANTRCVLTMTIASTLTAAAEQQRTVLATL